MGGSEGRGREFGRAVEMVAIGRMFACQGREKEGNV